MVAVRNCDAIPKARAMLFDADIPHLETLASCADFSGCRGLRERPRHGLGALAMVGAAHDNQAGGCC